MLIGRYRQLITVASARAMDTALLGARETDKYELWSVSDSGRAELPMTTDHQDTFTLGLAIDYTAQTDIVIGEKTHVPMPVLFILTTDGVLVAFHVMNSNSAIATLNKPSETIPTAGTLSQGVDFID